MSRARLVAGVCAAWIIVGVIVGAQTTLGATLMPNARAVPIDDALRTSLIQALPWIPVTLASVALAIRYPLGRGTWWRYLPVHLVAALLLSFVANVIVVLGFWFVGGNFQGVGALLRAGLLWATIRLHLGLLIYAGILGITQAVIWQRRARERELHLARVEGQLARAHVQALNAQIRPHFLFNTLHTIGQLWRSGRNDDGDAVLDHLGALFHKVQASTARESIPLAEELDMVRSYLAIEQTRFRDRLRTQIDASGDVLDCAVPPLILQPIVENAVRHGVSAISSAGLIEVRASRDNGTLRLVVRDDGPGPNGSSRKPGSGVGLRNTRERLAQLYGGRATLDVREADGGGAEVRIEIPLERRAE